VNKSNSQVNATSGEASEVSNSSGVSGLSQEKMDQLVALLQQANLFSSTATTASSPATNHISVSPQVSSSYTVPSSSSPLSAGIINSTTCSPLSDSYWLLDSGANEHICCNSKLFSSFYPIPAVHVNLPNGSHVIVTLAGNIIFSSQFYLTNVFYSPSFKLNLMSVAKVCQSLNCFFKFMPNPCIIHDLTSLKMIGLASQLDGLYKFHALSVSHNNVPCSSISNSCNIYVSSNSSHVIPNKAI